MKIVSLSLFICASLPAGELVYYPVNPSFGGSPLNGNWLLSNAQAQDKNKDPSLREKSNYEKFNERLQSSISSRLTSSITSQIFGQNGTLKPGTIDVGDFSVTVEDVGNGQLKITTIDKASGAESIFIVDQAI